jgi:hypothetical protein
VCLGTDILVINQRACALPVGGQLHLPRVAQLGGNSRACYTAPLLFISYLPPLAGNKFLCEVS